MKIYAEWNTVIITSKAKLWNRSLYSMINKQTQLKRSQKFVKSNKLNKWGLFFFSKSLWYIKLSNSVAKILAKSKISSVKKFMVSLRRQYNTYPIVRVAATSSRWIEKLWIGSLYILFTWANWLPDCLGVALSTASR